MIYSLVTRPVLQILRNGSGRGAIPMRQSVTKNSAGEIDKYNHSKWMTITGNWDGMSSAWVTFNGSANWSLPAFANDEQMQRIRSVAQTRPYLAAFNTTWKQKTSKKPPHARLLGLRPGAAHPGRARDRADLGQGDLQVHAALTRRGGCPGMSESQPIVSRVTTGWLSRSNVAPRV